MGNTQTQYPNQLSAAIDQQIRGRVTAMLGETWEDQYWRMHRQYGLLARTAASDKLEEIHDPDRARDILYHFCCDAFHLKDWIINADDQKPEIQQAVRAFLPKNHADPPSPALAMCADIANGFKHGGVDPDRYGCYTPGGPAEIVKHSKGASIPAPVPHHLSGNHWTIRAQASGKERYGLHVAKEAVDAWDAWLPTNGLALPSL
jgi:hypothetical protein